MPQDREPADFYKPETYAAEESVGYLMKRAMFSLTQQTGRLLEPDGLTPAQWGPLFKLYFGTATTVADLARQLEMDPGAMTRLLDRLEAKGLCRRVRSEADRRVVNVELTQDGLAVAQRIPVALSKVMNAHLSGFSAEELEQLKSFLRRILDNGGACRDEP